MIIRTSQDAELVDCCPCAPPACDSPRREYESISVTAFGFEMPAHPDVPPGESCVIYKVKTSSTEIDISQEDTLGEGLTHSYSDITSAISEVKRFCFTVNGVRVCGTGYRSISYDRTVVDTYTRTPPYPPGHNPSTSTVYSSSSTGTEEPTPTCSGTMTRTYASGEPTFTGPFPGCHSPDHDPTASWVFADGAFSRYTPTIGFVGGQTDKVTYSVPITAAMLTEELEVRIGLIANGDPWGFGAISSAIIYAETYSVQDPPSPPAEANPDFVPVLLCSQVSAVVKARYKVGIPGAWADFDGRHAEWVTDDPETRGEEPIKRTYFSAQWDEVFFSDEWTKWRAAKDAFDAATAAHEVWLACVTDCGGEPSIPGDPGAEPTPPSLVISRSWSYAGADEFSDWFVTNVQAAPGETRVVNMLAKCHRDTRLGVKPTSHGEVYEL